MACWISRTKSGVRRLATEFKPQIVGIFRWMNRATRFSPKGDYVHVARLGGFYNLKYYKECEHLIGNTRGIVKYIREQEAINRRRVCVCRISFRRAKRRRCRAFRFGVPDGVPLAVAVGWLHKNKGFDVLMNAMAKLPQFHLLLVGDGPEEGALKTQAKLLGVNNRVHFLGWRNDAAALVKSGDVTYVCPSRHEPLGNVVIEALGCGSAGSGCSQSGAIRTDQGYR